VPLSVRFGSILDKFGINFVSVKIRSKAVRTFSGELTVIENAKLYSN
jgi:hypothetical protein